MKKFLSRIFRKFFREEPSVNYSVSSLGLDDSQVSDVACLFAAAEAILSPLELHQSSMIYGLMVQQGMERARIKSLSVEIPGVIKLSATTEESGEAVKVFKTQGIIEQMYPFSRN